MPTFQELGLNEDVLRGIHELGFESPTPIQEKVIGVLLENKNDIIALAQTGTGKTAAFGLPVSQNIDVTQHKIQALVLTPTRELCNQIATDVTNYTKYMKGMKIVPVYGGEDIMRQIKRIEKPPQFLVATPGRLVDLIDRKKVDLSSLRFLVLDEADEMLNMGFKEDLTAIINHTPSERRTLLFSATMPREVSQIAKNYLTDPVEVSVGKKNSGSDNVSHEYYLAHAKDKYLVLKRIIDINPDIYSIVFCRTRQETQDIANKLMRDGYDADSLHGDLSQAMRDSVMEKFKMRNLHILVATDVAARGIDVNNLTHVINFSLPENHEIYNHRSGRTGRANNLGVCISIINMHERYKVNIIERGINKRIHPKQIPSGEDIWKAQLFAHIDKLQQIELDHEHIDPILNDVYSKLESLDRNELINRFVMMEFKRLLNYYKDAPDLNVRPRNEYSKDRNDRFGNDRGGRGGRDNRDDRYNDRGGRGGDRRSSGGGRFDDRRSGGNDRYSNRGRDNQDSGRGGDRRKGSSQSSGAPKFRLSINMGDNQNLTAPKLLGMINDAVGHKEIGVGQIKIERDRAYFSVSTHQAEEIISGFQKRFKKNKIRVDIEG